MNLEDATLWLRYCVGNPTGEVDPGAAEFLLGALGVLLTATERFAPEVDWRAMVDNHAS